MTVEPIPTGARLLHIGPHKTGSTALQSAFHQARTEMEAHHVRYGSVGRHDARAVRWLTERMLPGMDSAKQEKRWQRSVHRLRSEPGWRSVMSSEFFSDAHDHHIDRVAADLGVEDTWIAVTLRPLAKILPSQYQQALQRGSSATYDGFLRRRLDPSQGASALHFWVRHRHDELIRRWAERFGAERVVVVLVDSKDHGFLPRSFERLLDLPAGLLESQEALENRSMTAAEAQAVRRFNARFDRSTDRSEAFYINLMSRTMADLKSRPAAAGEPRLVTPDRYVQMGNEIGQQMAANIRALGVRVIGNLDSLGSVPLSGAEEVLPEGATVSAETADQFAWSVSQAALEMADPHYLSSTERLK